MLVVISHENDFLNFPQYYGRTPMPSLHEASVFAVAIFFAISGFIIVATAIDARGVPKMDRAVFAERRMVRIVPFLWATTISYNLMSWAGTRQMAWGAMTRTLVLWPWGDLKPNVAWSLRHEALFYTMFAALALGARPRWRLLALWLLAPALGFVLVDDLALVPLPVGAWWADLLRLVLMGGDNGANLQFGAGMLVAWAWLRGRTGPVCPPWLLPLGFMATAAVTVAWPLVPGLLRVAEWTAMAALVLLSAVALKHRIGWLHRGGLLLGNASFSLYLVHNTVMLLVLAAAKRLHLALPGAAALWGFLGFAVALSVVVSIAVHLAIERPLIRAVQRWLGLRRTARGAPL